MDIGAHKIKIVEGRYIKTGIEITNFFSIKTPSGALEDGTIMDKDLLYYALREGFKSKKIKTKNVFLTINSSKIITRELIIPKVKYKYINNIIKYQIKYSLPINIDDYILEFKIIQEFFVDNMDKLRLLIIAIPKAIVEAYYQLITSLDLNSIVLDYQPNSISKLLGHNNIVNDIFPLRQFTIASVDIGYDSTKISIIKNGKILLTRTVEMAGKFIDEKVLSLGCPKEDLEKFKKNIININYQYDGENIEEKILNIIKSSLLFIVEKIETIFRYYLTRDKNNKINIIILSGGISNISGLDSLFANIFDIPTITISTVDNVKFTGPIVEYANAIGSIIRTTEV